MQYAVYSCNQFCKQQFLIKILEQIFIIKFLVYGATPCSRGFLIQHLYCLFVFNSVSENSFNNLQPLAELKSKCLH